MRSKGVVLLGGAHGTLALARSLGRHGVRVSYLTHDSPLPGLSRFVRDNVRWSGPREPGALACLLDLSRRHDWQGDLLVPGGDAEVQFVSENRAELSAAFDIILPEWDALKWLCEKPLLYRRAGDLGVRAPETYDLTSVEQAAALDPAFPVVLKPSMGGGSSRLAKAKAVRADSREALARAYREAAAQIGAGNIVVQELIPGGGESQFSYAALWSEGAPVAEFAARRTRQYPVDFGYTSTFVETVSAPAAIASARAILGSVGYSGLVEIEFKRDGRDDSFKILDVNPRPWSWFGLCEAAGLDLGGLLWQVANGEPTAPVVARLGVAWMYLARDLVGAATLAARGRLGLGAYVRSLGRVRSWAAFSARDPLPGLVDLPLTVWRVVTRRMLGR